MRRNLPVLLPPNLTALLHRRPDLAGIGVSAAGPSEATS